MKCVAIEGGILFEEVEKITDAFGRGADTVIFRGFNLMSERRAVICFRSLNVMKLRFGDAMGLYNEVRDKLPPCISQRYICKPVTLLPWHYAFIDGTQSIRARLIAEKLGFELM